MKTFFKKLFVYVYVAGVLFAPDSYIFAGAVLPNAISTDKGLITITQAGASGKFQQELNSIAGLSAQNARLVFTKAKGVEGFASPVDVDMLKIDGYDSDASPFVGTTTGSLAITGIVYAVNGKVKFSVGTVVPATLNIFHIEKAIEKAINSYIGSAYISAIDVNNSQLVAHIGTNPNQAVSSNINPDSSKVNVDSKIVPDCNKTGDVTDDGSYYLRFSNPCNFERLIELVNNFMRYLLVYFATPLAAIIFAYAGFLLIFSGGNEHSKSHAKAIIGKVFLGYVIALAAWLIINTILSWVGFDPNWSFL